MRPRSGAIHSQSEEDYLQLAEASENRTGIFYDEKINRKVMSSLRNKNTPSPPKQLSPVNPELSAEKQKQSFPGFDFSQEGEFQRDEKQELQRMRTLALRQLNIAVVTGDPQRAVQQLGSALNSQAEQCVGSGVIDLVVGMRGATIYKCWVFNSEKWRSEDLLVGLYMKRCRWVAQLRGGRVEIKGGEKDIEWLLETLRLVAAH